MTGGALRLAHEERFSMIGSSSVKSFRRRCLQAELIRQQCWKLWRDHVGPLDNPQTDPVIPEIAVATHLCDRDVTVPIGNGTITGERLKTHALEAVRRRYDDRQR